MPRLDSLQYGVVGPDLDRSTRIKEEISLVCSAAITVAPTFLDANREGLLDGGFPVIFLESYGRYGTNLGRFCLDRLENVGRLYHQETRPNGVIIVGTARHSDLAKEVGTIFDGRSLILDWSANDIGVPAVLGNICTIRTLLPEISTQA